MTILDGWEKQASIEDQAVWELKALAKSMTAVLGPIWHIGDGEGGFVWEVLHSTFEQAGFSKVEYPSKPKKKTLSVSKRLRVFNRDRYACRRCGSNQNLTVDHIVPESKGGSSELENLQTLCRSHNSSKGTK